MSNLVLLSQANATWNLRQL